MSTRPSYPAKRAARKAARIAAEDLGMLGELLDRPTFSIRWVSPEEIGGHKGEVRGTETHKIFLSNTLSPTEAAKTVFHEARHLEQLRKGEIPALATRLSREEEERQEHIADGRMIYLWRKHKHEFESEPWFDEAL